MATTQNRIRVKADDLMASCPFVLERVRRDQSNQKIWIVEGRFLDPDRYEAETFWTRLVTSPQLEEVFTHKLPDYPVYLHSYIVQWDNPKQGVLHSGLCWILWDYRKDGELAPLYDYTVDGHLYGSPHTNMDYYEFSGVLYDEKGRPYYPVWSK